MHTHTAFFLIRADGSIRAVDSERGAAKTLCCLLCVLDTLRGPTRQPMINMSLTQTTGLLAVKSQSVANSLDISHGELHSPSTSVEREFRAHLLCNYKPTGAAGVVTINTVCLVHLYVEKISLCSAAKTEKHVLYSVSLTMYFFRQCHSYRITAVWKTPDIFVMSRSFRRQTAV